MWHPCPCCSYLILVLISTYVCIYIDKVVVVVMECIKYAGGPGVGGGMLSSKGRTPRLPSTFLSPFPQMGGAHVWRYSHFPVASNACCGSFVVEKKGWRCRCSRSWLQQQQQQEPLPEDVNSNDDIAVMGEKMASSVAEYSSTAASRRTLIAGAVVGGAIVALPPSAAAAASPPPRTRKRGGSKVPLEEYVPLEGRPELKVYDGPLQGRRASSASLPSPDAKQSSTGAEDGQQVTVHFDCYFRGIDAVSTRSARLLGGDRTLAEPFQFIVGQPVSSNAAMPTDSGGGGLFSGQGGPKPPPALTLAVKGMRAGEKRFVLVPPELGYGDKGEQEIPPGATFEMMIELLSIDPQP